MHFCDFGQNFKFAKSGIKRACRAFPENADYIFFHVNSCFGHDKAEIWQFIFII